ncbi:MAG: hypothetical protein WA070_12725, partial [Sphingobium sp.]
GYALPTPRAAQGSPSHQRSAILTGGPFCAPIRGPVCTPIDKQEAGVFFDDLSSEIIDDDVLQRLLTFPNVLMTGHQAFLTEEALTAIAQTTLASIADFVAGRPLRHQVDLGRTRGG